MKKKTFWSISEQENRVDSGTLKIRNEVIASIAAVATMEVEGVARTGKSVLNSLKGFFSRKIYERGAYIEFNDDNELRITVYVVAKYGANLALLASNIQSNIRSALEKMTGIIPSEVNVIIQGIQSIK